MQSNERDFFDNLAESWDNTRSVNTKKIEQLISMVGLSEGDQVLDIGCGTGVLLPFIKQAIGKSGNITALDFSSNMIKQAQQKNAHLEDISYVVSDIMEFLPGVQFNSIISLNFYPHVKDKAGYIVKMHGFLKDGGSLVIMHDISREAVNAIHGQCRAVKEDRLPAAEQVVQLLTQCGYVVAQYLDNGELYFIKVIKPAK